MKNWVTGVLLCFFFQATGFPLTADDDFTILKGEILKIEENKIKRVLMYEEGILEIINTKPGFVEFMGRESGETMVEIQTGTAKKIYRVNVTETDTEDLMMRLRKALFMHFSQDDISLSKNPLTGRIVMSGSLEEEELARVDALLGDYSRYVDNFLVKKESEDLVEISIDVIELSKDASQVLAQ